MYCTLCVLDCRYESWIEDGEGRTATVTFQKKHWFDTDITIRWLKWLRKQFPNQRIGLVWDHAPAHVNKVVEQFLREASTWLTTALIPGGLTSVLQVCDLIINKNLKQHIRTMYYQWRAEYVRRLRREEGIQGKLNVKIPRDTLIDICERAVEKMNQVQHENPTIREMFRKVGQDPFVDCSVKFKEHLDNLEKDTMYKTIINRQTATEF